MPNRDYMLKVADLIFRQALQKGEIANALDIDARRVTPLIQEVGQWLMEREHRLAEFERETVLDEKLANALCRKYPFLLDARVVRFGTVTTEAEYMQILRLFGRTAADWLDGIADDEIHIAVSGGQTVLELAGSLPERRRPGAHFYASAMIGRGRMLHTSHVGPETTATIMWSRSGRVEGHLHYATLPPLPHPTALSDPAEAHAKAQVEAGEALRQFSEYEPVREVLDDLESVDCAISGLGVIDTRNMPDRLSITGLFKPLGLSPKLLAEEGIVGDMSYNLLDAHGQGNPDWNCFLTAGYPDGLGFYRRMVSEKKPVLVMAGPFKESAIRAVLKGKLASVLVTDEPTARRLI